MKTCQTLKTVLLAMLLSAAIGAVAVAADKPALRPGKNQAIEVHRIKPSAADIRKAKKKPAAAGGPEVHAVKIYVEMPAPSAKAYVLYIGDTRIEQYGGFAEGIFFKTHNRADVESWKGKPVRFVTDKETIELGVAFPEIAKQQMSGELPELREVLKK